MRMKRNVFLGLGCAVLVAGLLAIGAQAKAQARDTEHAKHDGPDARPVKVDAREHHASATEHIGAVLKQLTSIETAIRHGRKDVALKELARARHLLVQLHAKAKKADAHRMGATKRIANVRCPIMGKKFDPAKLTANLTTVYNGQTIGVCCAGCIPAWNKLSAAQKRVKFQASLAAPPKAGRDRDMHDKHGH